MHIIIFGVKIKTKKLYENKFDIYAQYIKNIKIKTANINAIIIKMKKNKERELE